MASRVTPSSRLSTASDSDSIQTQPDLLPTECQQHDNRGDDYPNRNRC